MMCWWFVEGMKKKHGAIYFLGGGFKYFLFSPLPGEMIQFDEYFSKGLKPPTSFVVWLFDWKSNETSQHCFDEIKSMTGVFFPASFGEAHKWPKLPFEGLSHLCLRNQRVTSWRSCYIYHQNKVGYINISYMYKCLAMLCPPYLIQMTLMELQ